MAQPTLRKKEDPASTDPELVNDRKVEQALEKLLREQRITNIHLAEQTGIPSKHASELEQITNKHSE